jgi:nitrogen regulatory protein P-II 1
MPTLVTAIIKPHMLDQVRDALRSIGVAGITVTEVTGYGRQGGKTETFRGSEYHVDFVPKVKLEIVVPSTDVDHLVTVLADAANTGKIGDGKIWTTEVGTLMRIRTGELGDDAV